MNEIVFDTLADMPIGSIDITPEGSGCPVFSIPMSNEMKKTIEDEKKRKITEELAEKNAANIKTLALAKLEKLGLTEEEAKSIIGI